MVTHLTIVFCLVDICPAGVHPRGWDSWQRPPLHWPRPAGHWPRHHRSGTGGQGLQEQGAQAGTQQRVVKVAIGLFVEILTVIIYQIRVFECSSLFDYLTC